MIHRAGAMSKEGVQLCTRCGAVLTDYRGAMVPEDQAHEPLCGWAEGASVEVEEGFPRYSGITDDAPDCAAPEPRLVYPRLVG